MFMAEGLGSLAGVFDPLVADSVGMFLRVSSSLMAKVIGAVSCISSLFVAMGMGMRTFSRVFRWNVAAGIGWTRVLGSSGTLHISCKGIPHT